MVGLSAGGVVLQRKANGFRLREKKASRGNASTSRASTSPRSRCVTSHSCQQAHGQVQRRMAVWLGILCMGTCVCLCVDFGAGGCGRGFDLCRRVGVRRLVDMSVTVVGTQNVNVACACVLTSMLATCGACACAVVLLGGEASPHRHRH